ncbi:hypothetical protein A0U92_14850 [Acetobacter aceti]|uniref:DNA-directed RNA polymerase sigma-70 factor n=1 Tax=Acetobacter aceti TaxID=435 RepID=A0A1U9KJA4_ACEAC|nr:hypothetical protein A0U92_14850 [Acetobacter aceti]
MSKGRISGLFSRHRRELTDYVGKRLRDRDLAADFVQETFLRFVEHGDALPAGACRAFLFSTAHNLTVDHIRATQRRRTTAVTHEEIADIADDQAWPDQAAAARQRIRQLAAHLEELPPMTRRIFVLNRVTGLSYQQTATKLDISESSVQKHLAAALQHLLRRLPR